MTQTNSSITASARRCAPDYDWEIGTLTFVRNIKSPTSEGAGTSNGIFSPFGGSGISLKEAKSKEVDSDQ